METGVVLEIASLARQAAEPKVVDVDGFPRTRDELKDARQKPYLPDPIKVATLTGLADYVQKIADQDGAGGLFVQVVSPTNVRLIGPADETFRARAGWATATHEPKAFPFGQHLDPETFVISLLSLMATTPDRERILAMAGNLVDENVKTSQDDGVTQIVATKVGVARMGDAPVKNPVHLKPFRSFPEIPPVESPFLIRFRSQKDQLPAVALFECDGGKWSTATTAAIAEWLRGKLTIPVLA